MKKVILLVLVAITTTLSFAQNNKGTKTESKLTVEQRAQKNVDKINQIVGLTPEQQSKAHTMSLERITKMRDAKTKFKGSENEVARKQAFQSIRAEFKQQLKRLLTPEQLAKLKAHQKAQKEKTQKGKPQMDDDALPSVE